MKTFKKMFAVLFLVAAIVAVPVVLAGEPGDGSLDSFFIQLIETIKSLGGMSWNLKIAAFLTIGLSMFKLSILRPLWDKLGNYKALVAPAIALLTGVFTLDHITLPALAAYLLAGAGAIAFHELLDVIKSLPGVSGMATFLIEMIAKILLGKRA